MRQSLWFDSAYFVYKGVTEKGNDSHKFWAYFPDPKRPGCYACVWGKVGYPYQGLKDGMWPSELATKKREKKRKGYNYISKCPESVYTKNGLQKLLILLKEEKKNDKNNG